MLLLRGLRAIALLAAVLGAAAAQDTPTTSPANLTPAPAPPATTTPAPSTTAPTTAPSSTSATPAPASSDSSSSGSSRPASAIAAPVEDVLIVELSPNCESGYVDLSSGNLQVACTGCTTFMTTTLKPKLHINANEITEQLTVGELDYPALTDVQIASFDSVRPVVELKVVTLSALTQLNSLIYSGIDFTDSYMTLYVPASVTSLKIVDTNAKDVSVHVQGDDPSSLTQVEFTDNRFDQLPMLFYERSYGRVIEINSNFTFAAGTTDLSAQEYSNAKANLGSALDELVSFFDSCTSSEAKTSTADHIVCLNRQRTGIRTMSDRTLIPGEDASGSFSSSGSSSTTSAPSRSSSSSDTTLTIIVIVIAVVAAILAYFVARRYFCTSANSSASPRHNDRTVGLISKEESQAANGKLSFISGDDTLRQIRLEQQDISVGKSLGTGFLWTGDYQGRKVVIKRVEAESNDSRVTKALISQARSLVPVSHPNLAKLVGVTWIQGTDFGIVAEFMEKGTLKSVLMDLDTELDLQSKLHMCLDIAQALVYLHSPEQNMYMKSLSSRKVLVNGAIECKLNLFECHPMATKVEVPDVFGAGDMAWWAPELVLHKSALDPRKINIFSLGVLICEIVTRVSPYQSIVDEKGHTLADIELTQKIRRQERLQPHENRREFNELPAALREIVERCLSYQPHLRPTAEEVVQCLEAVKDYSERMGSTTSL